MECSLAWYRRGYWSSAGHCFDIGNTVRAALERFESDPERDPYAGSEDPHTAGNLMRLAPVVLLRRRDPRVAIADAVSSSRTTHAALAAVAACRFFAGLLVGALNGASREELLRPHYAPSNLSWEDEPLMPAIQAIAGGSFHAKDEGEIQASGYVAHTLEAALWAFARTGNFGDRCLLAVTPTRSKG
jgi:ADP-ribosyl-[dinitrogen reductase] hydrolase